MSLFMDNIIKNMNSTDDDKKLIIEKDFFNTIKFFKENFRQDILEDITVKEIEQNKYELTYKTYSNVYEEDTNFYTYVENGVESIQSLYENASEIENLISKKYNITFI